MSSTFVILISIAYVALLFLIAYYAEKREEKKRSLVNNSVTYALSLAVYCTAWTYYGSVGRATTSGIGFLPIYLGPAIFAPIWWIVLKKIILISKTQRITSIADFISSRYGKSTWLGIIATLIALFGIIPYISIQLKAISGSYQLLTGIEKLQEEVPFYQDSALYIAIALAIFTILFGTRNLDPNERHAGLVAAITFESILKLVAFLSVGLFVTYGIYNGFEDLFSAAFESKKIKQLFSFESSGINGWEWFWLLFLSMSAVLLLPRQFHVAVVENTDHQHLGRASWLFPLYLLLINLFVVPIAVAGLMHFPQATVEADTYVLSLPLAYGKDILALFVALGGFSAAASMVIVAVIALSIMIGNNLVLPLLLRKPPPLQEGPEEGLNKSLLGIRRISIVIVLLLSYAYFKAVGEQYSLVSVGLISFTAIAQFTPAVIGGIYWTRGTKKGTAWGLVVGFAIWAYTLPLPTLVEAGIMPANFIADGLWGLEWLRPYALFGLGGSSEIANAAFWSLLFNTFTYFFVSLNTTPSPLEISQASLFVNIYKYRTAGSDYEVVKRRARVSDIRLLLNRFLGIHKANVLLAGFEREKGIDFSTQKMAEADLVNYAETQLAGSIGAASAKLIIASITKDDPISLEEMFKVLEQTQEIIQYSKALEKKSAELEQTTRQLKAANEKLKELDDLKAEFIATVTHELRTPITSIRSLSKIMADTPGLPVEKRAEFLNIVVSESERLSRLINQVLDIEKIQAAGDNNDLKPLPLNQLLRETFQSLEQLMDEKGIQHELLLPRDTLTVMGNTDQLRQVIVNLLSNAIKFCDPDAGRIWIKLGIESGEALIEVADNGKGIPAKEQGLIFQKFTQITDYHTGKPQGSGLGLFISKTIVEQHGGNIRVKSQPGAPTTFLIQLPLHTP